MDLDRKIISQFLGGDEPSFKVIFNFFYPRLFHFVREYIPNDDIAENLVQDTFIILWKKRGEFRVDTNLNAWLYTVARNNCLKRLRDDKKRKGMFVSGIQNEQELDLNIGALSVLDTSDLTIGEIERIVNETLESLSPQCRKVFEMSRFGNKMNREIADELDISVKAVEGHITKALKAFKTNLKEYLPLISYLFVG